MITIKTAKKINLDQLDQELGGFGLCLNEENQDEKMNVIDNGSHLLIWK